MMGPTHAASGAAAGIATAITLSATGVADITAAEAVVFTGITSGAALVPDLDHPSATIARTFGPVTRLAAVATDKVSAATINATRGKRDKAVTGGHRGLTHTLLGVALAAGASWAAIAAWGHYAALALFFLFVTFSMHSLFRNQTRKIGTLVSTGIAAVMTAACWVYLPATVSAPALALAVVIGGVAHILGDAPTHSGVPNPLAPFVSIKGKRWGRVHLLPKGLRFSASGPVDRVLFTVFGLGSAVALVLAVTTPESVGATWLPLSSLV